MFKFVAPLLAVLLTLLGVSGECFAKRKALVIANSGYVNTTALTNPANDATLIAERLTELGFETSLLKDLTARQFSEEFHTFSTGLDKDTDVLFYFAGHGLQFRGENFMVGTDAQLRSEATLPLEAYSLNRIISVLERYAGMTMLFWDACRNNPLAEQLLRTVEAEEGPAAEAVRGLRRSGAAKLPERRGDTLIVFSAEPGKEALDGEGSHSPFAEALGRHIGFPNIEIESMLKRVQADVIKATRNSQRPERLSQLTREFYFKREDSPEAAKYEAEIKALRAQLAQLEKKPAPRRRLRIISADDPSFTRMAEAAPPKPLTRSLQTRNARPADAGPHAPSSEAAETGAVAIASPEKVAETPPAAPPAARVPIAETSQETSHETSHGSEIVVAVNAERAAVVRRLRVSPDAKLIAIGDDDGLVRIFRLEPFELVRTIRAHKARISDLDFSPDSKTLLTAGRDGPLRFWDLDTGAMTRELTAPKLVPYSARLNPAFPDRWVLAGDKQGRIVAWDIKRSRVITDRKFHNGPVLSVGYQPGGKGAYFSAGGDGEVNVRLPKGERSKVDAHSGPIFQAGYGASGETLYTVGKDRMVKLWNTKGKDPATLRNTLTGHLRYVIAADISADETMLASGGGDKAVNLWSTETGKLIGHLKGHTNDVEAIAFSPDGKYLVSASEDKSVRIWSIEHQDELIRLLFQKDAEQFVGVTFDNQTFGNRDAGLISIYVDGHEASAAEAERAVPHLGQRIAIRQD